MSHSGHHQLGRLVWVTSVPEIESFGGVVEKSTGDAVMCPLVDRWPNIVIWQFSPGHKGNADSDTGCTPASHIASQSLQYPVTIGVHRRTPFMAAAALSGEPEITDTEAVIAS
jgi:hypothetical protein